MREIQGMRFLVSLLIFVLLPAAVYAQAIEAPQLTFEQQVNIVVTVKKDPRVFDVKISQKNDKIVINLVVDQKQDRDEVKAIANNVIMITKSYSLDDRPKEKDVPGKGLYDYEVIAARPDGIILLTAFKAKAKEKISLENPFPPAMEPLTRADANGR